MFGPIPDAIKGIQHYVKLAEDHDSRNVLVAYYARMYAIQVAMKILPGSKPIDVSQYLMSLMDWLETTKREHKDVEGIANDTVAHALIEDYMLKVYEVAYQSDCNARFTKNVVKAYYTSGLLCEVLQQFGPLSDDMAEKGQISKYRATYIHNMLKQGLPPQPINVTVVESDEQEHEHVLSHDEINERRKQRGEDPLPSPPKSSPADSPFVLPNVDENNDLLFKPEVPTANIIDAAGPFIPTPTPRLPTPPEPVLPPVPVQRLPQPPVPQGSRRATLDPSQNEKAIKYCKWASSALNYDDTDTAIVNLEKALYLCQHGVEKP